MQRTELKKQLSQAPTFDLVVVGGGATGLGVALEAALRGFSVALFESHDFAGGTSSRSTKLLHGGVRYLAQGNIALVREALRERTTVLRNAPHLAQPLPFVMPSYQWWQTPFYGIGLKLYDLLAGRAGLGATEWLGAAQTKQALPGIRVDGLLGGVKYWDGQFDDARLALALARTAQRAGALVMNYMAVQAVTPATVGTDGGAGAQPGTQLVELLDRRDNSAHQVRARCVVNATGVWVDKLRSPAGGAPQRPMVSPSQGVHVVVDRTFLPGDHALLVPKTQDGRVLFAVPWLGKLILGTTDTPRKDLPREPRAFDDELVFILHEASRVLARPVTRADIRSIWVGLRPLVAAPEVGATKALSREHTIVVDPGGLVTVTGGKWTTYRAMAEHVLQACETSGQLPGRPAGASANHPLVGAANTHSGTPAVALHQPPGPHLYGGEIDQVRACPGADHALGAGLTEAMVRFAARSEYAHTVEDVLARRWRVLFLDAKLAAEMGPAVANILREETGTDPELQAFLDLCMSYLPGRSSAGPTK